MAEHCFFEWWTLGRVEHSCARPKTHQQDHRCGCGETVDTGNPSDYPEPLDGETCICRHPKPCPDHDAPEPPLWERQAEPHDGPVLPVEDSPSSKLGDGDGGTMKS